LETIEMSMSRTATHRLHDDGLNTAAGGATSAYARKLGSRIRQIRQQKGYSLTAVEMRSDEEFKASVLGAYERGERTIAVTRLMRLADHYDVPVDQMLPGVRSTDDGSHPSDVRSPLRLDLTKVARLGGPEGDMMRRHLGLLQTSRQDFNGRVMTVRHDDQIVLAAIFGLREAKVRDRLRELGLLIMS
jgi:transcriptional regulator with XRE-family HTH domain